MAILGTLVPANAGPSALQVAAGSLLGPASYSQAAGIAVATGLTNLVSQYRFRPDDGTFLAASDTGYAMRLTQAAGTITCHIWKFAGGAWAELANATDTSALTFRWAAIGN